MYYRRPEVWLVVAVFFCFPESSSTRETIADTISELAPNVNSLEEALSTLSNLSTAQKLAWEQQKEHEEKVKERNKREEEREAMRSKTLEGEHRLIKEIRGKISRKLKGMHRTSSKPESAPDWLTTYVLPKDCASIYLDGKESSGVYRVWPTWSKEEKGFLVYCDMDTDGGGWTVLNRWHDGIASSLYFRNTWNEYKNGFGDLDRDFWLGNERIHALTNQGHYNLRVDAFYDLTGIAGSATYDRFWIGPASSLYTFHVGVYKSSTTMSDHFSMLNDAQFSTHDYNMRCPSNCRTHWWLPEDCVLSKYFCFYDEDSNSAEGYSEMKIRPDRFIEMKEDA